MSEFDTRKKALLEPLFIEAGNALMDCQTFEYGLTLLLFHLARLDSITLDPQKVALILENQDKKTAGQLIAMLKKKANVSDGIEKALEVALASRNTLIHRILIDNAEKLPQAETRASLLKEIRSLRANVQKADKKLRPFIHAFGLELDGFDNRQFEAEAKATFT
ncbi:hypothetical protein F6R98_10520 [Candidatus Methylospira mobilis]|uniref:Uncharacterized protein n=1 Tax=Candidatus Methylospira mobilis TaxID=1808979 RepID=A0A5Q0BGL0_9GAMM|nr:hypothetical protein [Candidatus Methylospira mobilis]QFY42995.1 hypothetical protein F6R98_10520 [Candidatus Methylospira mobilis]